MYSYSAEYEFEYRLTEYEYIFIFSRISLGGRYSKAKAFQSSNPNRNSEDA